MTRQATTAVRGAPVMDQVPVTLITGFLGSGKTTLLSQLLQHPGMTNTAVIINEFGEIGLDHLLLAKPREDTVLLSNGCLCCSAQGEMIDALLSLTQDRIEGVIPEFDQVIIETTGLADPVQVMMPLLTEAGLCERYRLENVVTVVDAVNVLLQVETYHECVDQISAADQLLLSKVDLLEHYELDAIIERVQVMNPGAQLQTMEHGEIDPDTILAGGPQGTTITEETVRDWLQVDRFENSHGNHDDGIRSFSLKHTAEISKLGFELWLDMIGSFRGPNLLRLKGIMNVEGSPVLIQAVQHLFQPPVHLEAWPDDDRTTRLVCITRGVTS
mgnify:FL=1